MVLFFRQYLRILLSICFLFGALPIVFTQSNDVQGGEDPPVDTSAVVQEGDVPVEDSADSNTTIEDERILLFNDTTSQDIEVKTLGLGDVLRVFFILIVILGVGIGFLFFLKRIQTPRMATNEEIIEVMASKSLLQGSVVHLVKVGNAYLLLGNTNQSIQSLKEFTHKEEVDEITLALSRAQEQEVKKGNKSFLQKLRQKIMSGSVETTPLQVQKSKLGTSSSLLSFFRSFERKM